MADRTVLDLTTDTDRPVVAIDGVAYPLRTARDLTLQDYKHLERISMRTGDLLTRKRALTKAEDLELTARVKEVAKIAVDAPAAVLVKLTDVQRIMIFKVFTELLTPTLILAARAIGGDQTAAARSDGRRRSRGSSGSIPGVPTRRGPHGRQRA